jgi:hypothetical protein
MKSPEGQTKIFRWPHHHFQVIDHANVIASPDFGVIGRCVVVVVVVVGVE